MKFFLILGLIFCSCGMGEDENQESDSTSSTTINCNYFFDSQGILVGVTGPNEVNTEIETEVMDDINPEVAYNVEAPCGTFESHTTASYLPAQ
jgi:hypothetical protein